MKLLLLLLLIPLALADSGCFLDPDSPLFCQNIERSEAQEECTLFQECSVPEVFKSQPCDQQPACQKVLCDNCKEEFQGQCAKVAPENWCNPGCCQFQDFCEFTNNKDTCLIQVENRDVKSYRFDNSITEPVCLNQCQGTLAVPETILENKTIVKKEVKKPSFVVPIILILFILAIILFLLFKKHPKPETIPQKWYKPFQLNPIKQARIKYLKKKHEKKVKVYQRESYLKEQGLEPKKIPPDHFRKLDRIAGRNKPKPSLWNLLEKLKK